MLKGVRITFSLIALCIAIYSFISEQRQYAVPVYFLRGDGPHYRYRRNKKTENLATFAFLAGAGALFLSLSELLR